MLTNERIAELIADYTHGRCVDPWGFARAVEREARKMALDEAEMAVAKRTKLHTEYSSNWHIVHECAAAIPMPDGC